LAAIFVEHALTFAAQVVVKLARRANIMQLIRKLLHSADGATAIEYGLIAALIAVAAITAMQGMSNELQTTFNSSSSGMAAGNP
jgi:pilus assembly protein Flp/PilA